MQYQRISIYLVIIFMLSIIACVAKPAYATKTVLKPESSLRVSPVIITINLSPGKFTTQEITLENLSNFPAPIRANLTDFTATGEDGGYTFPETKTNPLVSWTKISPEELIIPPHTKQKVILTFSLPKIIPVGGYFGMLFFEPVPQQQSDKTKIVSRIGVLLLGNLGVQDKNEKKADILTFTLPILQETPTIPYLLRVQNTSLNHITTKPIFTIKPLFGSNQRSILEDKVIFPGKVRRWEGNLTLPDQSFGIYKISVTSASGNNTIIQSERIILIAPYVKILIVASLLLFLAILFTYRKRIVPALKILIRG